jgi:predicted RNase H-like HicB family nuclease
LPYADNNLILGEVYSAYPPDLPGCAATGATLAQVQQQIKEAIEFHLEGLREEGLPIPEPTTLCEYVEAR